MLTKQTSDAVKAYLPDRDFLSDTVAHSLWHALHECERDHADNTGARCDVGRNRDDCCRFCSTAEVIREALREVGVNAIWRRVDDGDGETAVVSDDELEDWEAEQRRDRWLSSPAGDE